ncbi:LysR family transcriptional regulator [uncultured Devosia sp.]|uniref:LysR family transcriptional regulator n=1 Tax=uncultured Devosia sp. TaxID=211434 RepID=UPI0026350FC2|nr:LysR family transcriptional regulator [uncultured Devosia sp.]
MDKLSVMNAFRRIVERGSFVGAANDLGVSAGLLSKEIKLLEKSLGCTLVTRTTRSMSLTEAGHAYYDQAVTILSAVTALENDIRANASSLSGQLKINAPHSFGQLVIAPMLPGFLQDHPDLEVTLSLDDHILDMIEGGFDISIRIRPSLPDSSLIIRRLGQLRQAIFASPTYLERFGTPERPEEIAGHDVIGFTLAGHQSEWLLLGPGEPKKLTLRPRIKVGSSVVLRDLLIAGCGIGTLPDFISREPERDGRLVRVLPEYELPSPEIFAVTASHMGSDPRAKAFVAHLRDALNALYS